MMRSMTLTEIGTVIHGALHGADVSFSQVSTDTRTLQPGELFVALQGPRFDGNSMLDQAREAGAVAAVISRDTGVSLPHLLVEDTARALSGIAAYNRGLSAACVLAVTGSQGKTTVKEMLAAILRQCGSTLVTRANLNNTLGVPMTLLGLAGEHEFAVIEMGANMAGEIANSVAVAQPDIAHITNVAPTHLEGFGSLEGVSRAKAEIWQGIRDGGTAIINLDDPFADQWLQDNTERRRITVSADGRDDADYAVLSFSLDPLTGSEALLRSPTGNFSVMLALPGKHNLANALAATAMAMEAGAGIAAVQQGLAGMQAVPGRMVRSVGINGAAIIDDSYNASPASFRAAIDVLASCPGTTILVMGDMGELGAIRDSAHRETGEYARAAGITTLLATGEKSTLACEAFGSQASHFSSREALLNHLKPLLASEVTVLVKGSRSARMDQLIAPLTRGVT